MPISASDTQEYTLLKTGEREVILDNIEEKTSSTTGNKYLALRFRIRDDIEQEDAGRVIFENFYKEKDGSGDYAKAKVGALLRAQGKTRAEGGTYDFDDYDEFMQFVMGMKLRLTIATEEPNDYHDDTINLVKYCSYKPTKFPNKTGFEPTDSNGNKVEIKKVDVEEVDPDDLPF